jgi:hypothetical protein
MAKSYELTVNLDALSEGIFRRSRSDLLLTQLALSVAAMLHRSAMLFPAKSLLFLACAKLARILFLVLKRRTASV